LLFTEIVPPALFPRYAVTAKVYKVNCFRFVKVYEVAVLARFLVILVAPVVAVTLMALILVLEKASQESFAVVAVVEALTLVALGTALIALALAAPSSKAVMTKRDAKRNFKEYLTSSESGCRNHQGWNSGCNQPAWS